MSSVNVRQIGGIDLTTNAANITYQVLFIYNNIHGLLADNQTKYIAHVQCADRCIVFISLPVSYKFVLVVVVACL